MKNLLNAVSPILNAKTAKVTMDISAASTEGELMVIVKPLVGVVSDKAPEELKQLNAALAQPIRVIGEPDSIEAKLAEIVEEQAPKRNEWANRAAELDASIGAGASKDAKRGGSKPAKTATTGTTVPANNSGPLVSVDDNDGAADETTKADFGL